MRKSDEWIFLPWLIEFEILMHGILINRRHYKDQDESLLNAYEIFILPLIHFVIFHALFFILCSNAPPILVKTTSKLSLNMLYNNFGW